MDIKWCEDHLEIGSLPISKPKKITGTRFGAILDANKWNSPFKTWCEITKVYTEPFEDTIYTIAGKTIEPKQIEYMRKAYGMFVTSPTDVYGADFFKKTYGDFYPKEKIFGGMWDALETDEDGSIESVLEFKTTKRVEDWEDDIPEYYALQGALYGYLLGVDDVIMVCSFLSDADYEHPENFVPSVENTITRPFKISERYGDFFENYIKPAEEWWNTYVVGGKSPCFDDRDKDIIKALRTDVVEDDSLDGLLSRAEELIQYINNIKNAIADDEKELKLITEMIKNKLSESINDDCDKVEITNGHRTWTLSKSVKEDVDKDKMKEDGIFDKYSHKSETLTLRNKENK